MSQQPEEVLRIRLLQTGDEVEKIIPAWKEIWAQSGPYGVFLAPEWILQWWEHFHPGKRLAIVLVLSQKGEIVGLGPWCLEIRWGFRVLRTLGHGFIDFEGVLIRRGMERPVAAALQQWLLSSGIYDEAVFERLPYNVWDGIGPNSRGKGMSIENLPSAVSPYTLLSPNWQSFEDQLDRKFVADTRRQIRRLEALGTLHLRSVESQDELEERFGEFLLWKRMRYDERYLTEEDIYGSGGFWGIAPVSSYYRGVAGQLLKSGSLAFSSLLLGGKVVSLVYGMEKDGTYFYFAPAYHPEYGRFSVGRVHVWLMMRELSTRGLQCFEFLIGNEDYKHKWASGARKLAAIRLYRQAPVSLLRGVAPKAYDKLAGTRTVRHLRQWMRSRLCGRKET